MRRAVILSLLVVADVLVHCECHPAPLHQAARRQEITRPSSRDEPSSEGRENVMSFLTALDQARRSAKGRIRSEVARAKANGKRADKNVDTEVMEEFTDRPFPAGKEKETKDRPIAPSPLKEKDPKKTKKQPGRKSNQRACFWKYCN